MIPTDASLREMEASSIREFVQDASSFLTGQVLDFGAGKTPYRSIVEQAGGTYVPYDRIRHPASVASTDVGPDFPLQMTERWDAILCTQVIQYLSSPTLWMDAMREALRYRGALVMTGPTTWPLIEQADLWRFTLPGVRFLLRDFQIAKLEERGVFDVGGFRLSLGFGVVAVR